MLPPAHSLFSCPQCVYQVGSKLGMGTQSWPTIAPYTGGRSTLAHSNHHHYFPGAASAESWNPWPELQLKPGHSLVEHNYPDWHPNSCPRLTFQFGVSHNFSTYPCTPRTTGLQKDKTFPHLEKTGIFFPLCGMLRNFLSICLAYSSLFFKHLKTA